MTKEMTSAQRAYEERRAQKAGLSLEAWLRQKANAEAAATRDAERARAAEARAKAPPGRLKRVLDRLHKPLKPKP